VDVVRWKPQQLVGRQQEVFQFIRLNPGVHLREMQRRLSVSSMGNLEYHITILKRLNLIMEETEGGYKRYYPVQGRVKNKKLLALLMQKVPCRIALLVLDRMRINGCLEMGGTERDGREETSILDNDPAGNDPEADDGIQDDRGSREVRTEITGSEPGDRERDIVSCGVTPLELMEELGLSSPALSYHLSKMHKLGVLGKEKQGKKVYYLVVDPEEVLRIIVSYQQSFTDGLVTSLMAGWGL